MPTVAYEVIVSQSGNQSENVAVANAVKEIVYADTSKSFAYADVFDVNIYGPTSGAGAVGRDKPNSQSASESQDYGIAVCVAIPVAASQDKARFEKEMDTLAKVETFEEVHYQRLDKSEV